MYRIEYSADVEQDLRAIPAFHRNRILDAIDELTREPLRPTRNRKPLEGLVPPFEHVAPVWELRVGEHRVFYDVDQEEGRVTVRAVRRKPPHKPTEEIL